MKSGFESAQGIAGIDWREETLTWNNAPGNDVGSPELDRTTASVHAVTMQPDGLGVELRCDPLLTGRVYCIAAEGVRSPQGEELVHPMGAYTLNQIPD